LEAAKLSNYPAENVTKSIGEGKIVFIPLVIPDHKFLTKFEQKEGTFFGSSMVDIFADVPEAYTRDNMNPELRSKLSLVAEESAKILNSRITKVDGDNKFVELSTMRKNNEHLLIHLVNYDVTVDGDITQAVNVSVQIAIPKDRKVKGITYSGNLGQMETINFQENENSTINVIFPAVNIYGLACVELM
jgi:hypothetical protein